jgi:hypothetical protein
MENDPAVEARWRGLEDSGLSDRAFGEPVGYGAYSSLSGRAFGGPVGCGALVLGWTRGILLAR